MPLRVPVEEYTTPNPVTATEDLSIEELRQCMDAHGVRHLPVMRGDAVVGVISERDLRLVEGLSREHRFQVQARDLLRTDPVSVRADTPLDDVAYVMSDRKIGSVIVTEADGSFLGIFTVTDALNALIEVSRARPSSR
ncbi:MAG: CBS domain-containing protein [Proteobacteria bacterium]|jgi:acetoin utilization protein AcuB|nr:CBS domain-containing protein [Pseudomonadota bacterium]